MASCVKISKRSERWWEMYEGTSGSVAHTTSRALISTTTLTLICVWGEGVGREWGRGCGEGVGEGMWGGCGGGDVRMKGEQGRYGKRLVNENTVAVRNE